MSRRRKANKLRSWQEVARIMNARAEVVGELSGEPPEHYSDETVRRIGLAAMEKMRLALLEEGVDLDAYNTYRRMKRA